MTPQLCKTKREKLGLSMDQIAIAAGVSMWTIYRFEHGKSTLRPHTLKQIEEAFEQL